MTPSVAPPVTDDVPARATASPSAPASGRIGVLASAARVGGAMRDTWLVVGLALALLLLLESGYRAQAAVRLPTAEAHSPPPSHPYADAAWFPAYLEEERRSAVLRWRPYVYVRSQPFTGRFVNVDARGLRRTVPQPTTATPRKRVFLFGGSTMFGAFQRDSLTIASRVAARLASGQGGALDVEVTNYGQTGRVFDQSILELQMELRSGARPDVVVFYDGINDVAAAVQNREAGLPQNEGNRVREFELGRVLFSPREDLATDAKALGRLAALAGDHLQLIRRLRRSLAPAPPALPPADSLAAAVARSYLASVEIVEALAARYGFRPLYVWQSTIHTTRKPLTDHERALLARIEADPTWRRIRDVHLLLPSRIDSSMRRTVSPERFVDQSGLFASENNTVYVDPIGHATESSVDMIVDAFWPQLSALLSSRVRVGD